MGGELSEPMLISSQSSSANGPPPRKIILGRNLKIHIHRLGLQSLSGAPHYTNLSIGTLSVLHRSSIPCVPMRCWSSFSMAAVLSSESTSIGYMSWYFAVASRSGKDVVGAILRGREPL